jgi:replication-associated recombination protein RarA
VFVLNELTEEDMEQIIARTKLKVPKAAREWLIQMVQGDARQAITVLENAQKLYGKITLESLHQSCPSDRPSDRRQLGCAFPQAP